MMIRQGDVLLKKIDKKPEAFYKERENGIVAYGEVTGHAHRISNGLVLDYVDRLIVDAFSGAKITHDEHDAVDLDEGVYEVIIQREFTAGDVQRVLD